MKGKNPLYVVKGKTVEEAKGMFDLLVKKFNLGPVVDILKNIIEGLLANVRDYHTFVMVKQVIDEILQKVIHFTQKFHQHKAH